MEGYRTTVRRIRELLEGERDLSEIKPGDWFAAIEYVREETGVELVLYREDRYADAPDSAKITSLGDDGLWCIVAGWSERAGFSRDKIAKFDMEESMRFAQSDDPVPELLPLAEAKRRAKAFAEAH
ncbi:hypothetical protein [Natrinema thermotolerans]